MSSTHDDSAAKGGIGSTGGSRATSGPRADVAHADHEGHAVAEASAAAPAPAPRRRRRGCFSRLLGLLVVALLIEAAVRVVLPIYHRPLLSAPRHVFFPELHEAESPPIAGESAVLEVLLLGGSVLDPMWSDTARRLQERLTAALAPREVIVHDLACAGHTTLDSFYKLRHLQDRHFDAIVVYHGINDVRANNCPPDVFSRDYDQYLWYRALASIEPPPDETFARAANQPFLLPLGVVGVSLAAANWLGLIHCVPLGEPPEDWLDFGATLKTRETFAANLAGMAELARASGARLVLPIFATCVPPDYSREAFEAGTLSYGRGGQPLELWGRADNVLAGIAAHEQLVRARAAADDNVTLVETDSVSALGGAGFRDACHLTSRGAEALAICLEAALVPVLRER